MAIHVQVRPRSAIPRLVRDDPRRVALTKAELEPCTCPEPCERDHDRD